MLSPSSFDDRYLIESFYGELFNRFYSACNSSVRVLLRGCAFGIAPNRNKVRTFFIVAPNRDVAEKLTQHIEGIIQQAVELMPGIPQTAICYNVTPENRVEESPDVANSRRSSSKLMVGKFFPNISLN
ncbi:MAG TPA: hypothetical protein DDW76_29965 [Cyanobacteria bacterium UBA11369]|nr:hypothetical protein [Cyanobacteria bacterium UBA11371]HBE33771.1 hypothetical protein [Cyanobacteria bacterium UBA11368]HBE52873.1 hypothetical protein [Cyanobacteria bacterium UBA11369]